MNKKKIQKKHDELNGDKKLENEEEEKETSSGKTTIAAPVRKQKNNGIK